MANTTGKGLKVSIKTKEGEKVDITHHLRAVTFGKQITRIRGGILGWLAWTFNIQKLKWITQNYVDGETITAEEMNAITASGGLHISGPIGEPTIYIPADGRTYTVKKDGDAIF